MDFQTFVTQKLNFINDELGTLKIAVDLLRAEVEMLKVRTAVLETQTTEVIWWMRAIGGACVAYLVASLLKLIHTLKRK